MEKEPEVFRDIPGYEGLYQVSNWGRVYSLPKEWGKGKHDGKILSIKKDNKYLRVTLICNKRKTYNINRLVAEVFIPNPNNYPLVMHLDDNPLNNYHKNLQWGTHKMNSEDMVNKHRSAKGELQGGSKLNNEQVLSIRNKYSTNNYTYRKLALEYNVSKSMIEAIVNRKNWTHI